MSSASARSDMTFERGESHFRRLLDKLPAAAYMCDPNGLITYYNQRAVTLWGRDPKINDPVDRWCGSFKLCSADGEPIKHDECWMALALYNDREYNGHEIRIQRPNGDWLTALAHANPIHDSEGRSIGAVNVLVDISDRKNSEEQLRDADAAKNEFLATLAHELRNPLAPIRNALEVLQVKGELSGDARLAVEIIDRQVDNLTRLVEDLLDVARITGNKLELRKDRVDLANVVTAAIETSRPMIDANAHSLAVSLPEEPLFVEGDLARLAQVVSNLLNNAAKYTSPGGNISVSTERIGSDAVVVVRDTGIGISSQMLPHIFDMFTQATHPQHTPKDGLGIGLTLVRRLVEMHNGTVSAHSAGAGEGSEFVVRLPVLPAEGTSPRNPRGQPVGYPKLDLRVLVADDNADSVATLSMLLRALGCDVRIAHDGETALRVASELRPHVMLLDIGMPKVNGYEVARQTRQASWGANVVLAAVTGWGQETDRERSRDAGFDHHLVKPLDFSELISMLTALSQAHSTAGVRT
jgi:signal transduction histidine kinase/ActR/RegA family two-component response regulator